MMRSKMASPKITKELMNGLSEKIKRAIDKLPKDTNGVDSSPGSATTEMPHNNKSLQSILVKISNVLHEVVRSFNAAQYAQNEFLIYFLNNLSETLARLRDVNTPTAHATWDALVVRLDFMLAELNAFFVDNTVQTVYKITKPEPREWWNLHFGTQLVIEWHQFEFIFVAEMKIPQDMALFLRETMSFTSRDFLTIFAFDLFTRLFTPWDYLPMIWTALVVDNPAYFGMVSFCALKNILRDSKRQGTFGYRVSSSHLGLWAIGYAIDDQGATSQSICRCRNLADFLHQGQKNNLYKYAGISAGFPEQIHSIVGLKQRIILPPDHSPAYVTSPDDCNEETCTLCFDETLDIRIEPCLHYAGQRCIRKNMSFELERGERHYKCPFCRNKVESVTIVNRITQPESATSCAADKSLECFKQLDIVRAMRVASGDANLALKILCEFVQPK